MSSMNFMLEKVKTIELTAEWDLCEALDQRLYSFCVYLRSLDRPENNGVSCQVFAQKVNKSSRKKKKSARKRLVRKVFKDWRLKRTLRRVR